MDRNRIKIICDSQNGTLSYRFQNEEMKWMPLSRFSVLSQRQFTMTSIRQSALEILNVIQRVYNPKNRGVQVLFEGLDKDFAYLCKVLEEEFPNGTIYCDRIRKNVIVAGKRSVGKTTLIEALARKRGIQYTTVAEAGYTHYESEQDFIEWYEVEGIDLGGDNVKRIERVIDTLAEQGMALLLYCLDSDRVEPSEMQLVQHMRDTYSEISLLGILTNAVSLDASETVEKTGQMLGVKMLPILAEDKRVRGGVIQAYGHEDVLQAILVGE